MSAEVQTVIALILVATAATWLVARVFAKRKNSGCSSCGGCPTSELKTKIQP